MLKTIYTALIGAYEELKEPIIVTPGWRYVCFTDQPITSNVWDVIRIDDNGHAQRRAREIKLQPHVYLPDTDFSIWLDASFLINIDLNTLWDKCFKPPFSCAKHPIRNDIFQEIASCISNNRGDRAELERQRQYYQTLGLPRFNGVITSGFLLRQHTPEVIELCNRWWAEVQEYSTRDQVAFAKVSIGCDFINTFIWDYSQSKELRHVKHYKHR